MTQKRHVTLAMPGDESSGGLPYVVVPDDMDQWPSESVTEKAFATIVHVHDLGFCGVKIQASPMSDGVLYCHFLLNVKTPEGRMVDALLMLARLGKTIPTDTAISILERVYLDHGLALPSKIKPGKAASK